VERPNELELAVNLKVTRELGILLPREGLNNVQSRARSARRLAAAAGIRACPRVL